jgi:hypothetical protein
MEQSNLQPPILEIIEPIQIVGFANKGNNPLILQTKHNRILVFGTQEESFGHEMTRFQFISNNEPLQDSKDNSFFAYSHPGLIFSESGRYLFFNSPVGGTGLFNPSERQFAIMYPLIAVDLLNKRFAFVDPSMNSPFSVESVLEKIKSSNHEWYSGFHKTDVITKFRELHPMINVEVAQAAPSKSSFLKSVFKLLGITE